jgi:hypothetical protein
MTQLHAFRPAVLTSALLLALATVACGDGHDHAHEPAAATAAAQPSPTTGAVTFEPAYPAEVSPEGLTEQDVTQQETPHSHDGGEEHTHGDEEDHDAGEGDHGHPH